MDKLRIVYLTNYKNGYETHPAGILLLQEHLPKYCLSKNVFLILNLLCKNL